MPDTEKIKKLRSLSGAGFKDCSSALEETNGDLDKAIEVLRVKGIAKASKKMSRSANEGVILICENSQNSSILEINCETDFVAKPILLILQKNWVILIITLNQQRKLLSST